MFSDIEMGLIAAEAGVGRADVGRPTLLGSAFFWRA